VHVLKNLLRKAAKKYLQKGAKETKKNNNIKIFTLRDLLEKMV